MKKKRIHSFVFASVIALSTLAIGVPAHATVSGSEPRPQGNTAALYVSVLLSVLGL